MKRFLIFAATCVFVVVALSALLPSLSHPEANRRIHCHNNVRQIVLALQNYHDDFGAFPPRYIADASGRPQHSWRVLILPYLDAQEVYDRYRFDEPWNSEHNLSLQDEIPQVYQCPSFVLDHRNRAPDTQHFERLTNYVAISDSRGIFGGSISHGFSDVTDGTANTVLVAEVRNHAVHWLEPSDISLNDVISDLLLSADDAHANHSDGLLFGMADGSVEFIPADTDVETIEEMVTRAGGEPRGAF